MVKVLLRNSVAIRTLHGDHIRVTGETGKIGGHNEQKLNLIPS